MDCKCRVWNLKQWKAVEFLVVVFFLKTWSWSHLSFFSQPRLFLEWPAILGYPGLREISWGTGFWSLKLESFRQTRAGRLTVESIWLYMWDLPSPWQSSHLPLRESPLFLRSCVDFIICRNSFFNMHILYIIHSGRAHSHRVASWE